jgi:Sel1 repeat
MNRIFALLGLFAVLMLPGQVLAQRAAPSGDDNVAQIPQTSPGSPWSFIGFGITTPTDPLWFVANSTPRGGTMGRNLSATPPNTAVLVIVSELLDQPIESDTELLAVAKDRHARIGERWIVSKHEETIVRHAGTRCARHALTAREPEDRSPRKDAAKTNATRPYLHVSGLSCVHPTEPRLLVEVGLSERSPRDAMTAAIARDAQQATGSITFQRYSEQALQKSAELARVGEVKDAEALLKPYIDADAAWARYFLGQILQRAVPRPPEAGPRLKALLEPAAERGLADAQWMLGTLLLRGAEGVPKDPPLAEALLRRASERGNPGAAFQLGIALLSPNDGLSPNRREAVVWISRAAARGQKEAQELLQSARDTPAPSPLRPAGK